MRTVACFEQPFPILYADGLLRLVTGKEFPNRKSQLLPIAISRFILSTWNFPSYRYRTRVALTQQAEGRRLSVKNRTRCAV